MLHNRVTTFFSRLVRRPTLQDIMRFELEETQLKRVSALDNTEYSKAIASYYDGKIARYSAELLAMQIRDLQADANNQKVTVPKTGCAGDDPL